MTPLDSSHLEVFLVIFHFFNSNLNFEFGPVWYRPKPEPGRTGLTGNRSNRIGSHWFCKPWCWPVLPGAATEKSAIVGDGAGRRRSKDPLRAWSWPLVLSVLAMPPPASRSAATACEPLLPQPDGVRPHQDHRQVVLSQSASPFSFPNFAEGYPVQSPNW